MNTLISQEKIMPAAEGDGGLTPGDIERRAKEIAFMSGRSGGEPTLEDREKAVAELRG